MKFEHTLRYAAPPDDVYAMLGQPAFRERVCEEMHALRHDISIEPDGTGMSVLVEHTRSTSGVPSIASRFVGEEIAVRQEEAWADASTAALEVSIPGKPGHLRGAVALESARSGTVETVSGDISVSIPVIGGRLERLIGDVLVAALDAEHRVGEAWLAGQ